MTAVQPGRAVHTVLFRGSFVVPRQHKASCSPALLSPSLQAGLMASAHQRCAAACVNLVTPGLALRYKRTVCSGRMRLSSKCSTTFDLGLCRFRSTSVALRGEVMCRCVIDDIWFHRTRLEATPVIRSSSVAALETLRRTNHKCVRAYVVASSHPGRALAPYRAAAYSSEVSG